MDVLDHLWVKCSPLGPYGLLSLRSWIGQGALEFQGSMFPSSLSAFEVAVLLLCQRHLAMGQNPVPPVSIPIPTKIGSKMGGAFTYQPKWDPIGFEPQPFVFGQLSTQVPVFSHRQAKPPAVRLPRTALETWPENRLRKPMPKGVDPYGQFSYLQHAYICHKYMGNPAAR